MQGNYPVITLCGSTRFKGRLHYEDAISKWECDRTHIANYRSNELETIKAESISTKRRI